MPSKSPEEGVKFEAQCLVLILRKDHSVFPLAGLAEELILVRSETWVDVDELLKAIEAKSMDRLKVVLGGLGRGEEVRRLGRRCLGRRPEAIGVERGDGSELPGERRHPQWERLVEVGRAESERKTVR
jgi:hypothetical protein